MLYVNPLERLQINNTDPVTANARKEKVALEEFEHMLLNNLMQEMHKTTTWGVDKSEKSQEKEFTADMLNDALGGVMAKSGQLGVAKQISDQLRAAESKAKLTTSTN